MDSSMKPSSTTASAVPTNSSSIPSANFGQHQQTAAMSYGYIYCGYPQPFYASTMMPTAIPTNQQPMLRPPHQVPAPPLPSPHQVPPPPPPSPYQVPPLQIPRPPPPQILPPSLSPSTIPLQASINSYNQMVNPFQSFMPYHSMPTTPTQQYPVAYFPNYISPLPNVAQVTSIPSIATQHNSSPTIPSKPTYSSKTSNVSITKPTYSSKTSNVSITNNSSLSDLHSRKISQTKPKTFLCQICNMTFPENSFWKHMSGHKNKKQMEKLNTINIEKIDEQKRLNISKMQGKKRFENSPNVSIFCRMCDVPCNSLDAYISHINGQKHNKMTGSKQIQLDAKTVSELRMPKILPDDVSPSFKQMVFELVNTTELLSNKTCQSSIIEAQVSSLIESNVPKPPPTPPKIVESSPKVCQDIDNDGDEEYQFDDAVEEHQFDKFNYGDVKCKLDDVHAINADDEEDLISDKSIGQDFIEEVLDQKGNIVCYTCTLCEVRFNDVNGKNLHIKGKRHRVQYKKRVDPSLIVESIKSDKKKLAKVKMAKEKISQEKTSMVSNRIRFSQDLDPFTSKEDFREFSSLQSTCKPAKVNYCRSFCDMLMETRHLEILPLKKELEYIHKTAQLVEKSILSVGKLIESNFLMTISDPKIKYVNKSIMDITKIDNLLQNDLDNLKTKKLNKAEFIQILRTGPMGQGILLRGERKLELIIYSSILPTKCLLVMFERFVKNKIMRLCKDRSQYEKDYSVQSTLNIEECKFELSLNNGLDPENLLHFDIYLTCPYIKNEKPEILLAEAADLLDINKCLESLRKIRHFRWSKKQPIDYWTYNFVLRLLRDVLERANYLPLLSFWCYQVITEEVMSGAKYSLTPSTIFRYIFEKLSSGVLNPRGGGIADPCESVVVDIFSYLKPQDRENLTYAVTHTLRLLCLRQMNLILEITEEQADDLRTIDKPAGNQLTSKFEKTQSFEFFEHSYLPKFQPSFSGKHGMKRKKSTYVKLKNIRLSQPADVITVSSYNMSDGSQARKKKFKSKP